MKKILCVLCVLMLLTALFASCNNTPPAQETGTGGEESETPSTQGTGEGGEKSEASSENTVSVGDTLFLGSYEQDNRTENGKEAIEWKVLKVENGKALVVSYYALDVKLYHETQADVTWENCTLRTWLNNDFYNAAFTAEEQTKILTTTVVNADNLVCGTDAGNDTSDRIFLLSISEAERYFASDEARVCQATAYTIAQGALIVTNMDGYGNTMWRLRSPGSNGKSAAMIFYDGNVRVEGNAVNGINYAVRPAFWIDLES